MIQNAGPTLGLLEVEKARVLFGNKRGTKKKDKKKNKTQR